ncbi:hypothetical protein [Nonomuraea dietziae]|uniref:hypothetical protein n=1 Tax=Nonomuraea dietziae TaxID=65515 RepID=UPI003319B8EE
MRIGAALRTARQRHEDPFDALTAALAGTISTPDIMRTPAALDCFGPATFGLPDPYTPGEQLEHRSATEITYDDVDNLAAGRRRVQRRGLPGHRRASSAQQQWFPAGPTTVGAGPWSVSAAVVVEVASTAATTRALRARTRCPRRERTANLLLS